MAETLPDGRLDPQLGPVRRNRNIEIDQSTVDEQRETQSGQTLGGGAAIHQRVALPWPFRIRSAIPHHTSTTNLPWTTTAQAAPASSPPPKFASNASLTAEKPGSQSPAMTRVWPWWRPTRG